MKLYCRPGIRRLGYLILARLAFNEVVAREPAGQGHFLRSGSSGRVERAPAIPRVVYVTSFEYELRGDLKRLWDHNRALLPRQARLDYYDDERMYRSARDIGKALEAKGIVTGAFEAYNNLRPGAYRADLWRYMKLWADGGVYFDAKMELLKPLEQWVNFDDGSLQLVKDVPRGYFWNAVIAVGPKSKRLEAVIKFVVGQVKRHTYRRDLPSYHAALAITGPGALGEGLGLRGVSGVDGNWQFTHFASVQGSDSNLVIDGKFEHNPHESVVVSEVNHTRLARVDEAVHKSLRGGSYAEAWAHNRVYCDEPGWPPCGY